MLPIARRPFTVIVCALALAGCTSDPGENSTDKVPAVQLGAPGESNRALSEDELDRLSSPAYTDADVAFVQGMIHHHRQALEMTAMVADRTQNVDMTQLTERMDVSQTDEIAQLENWLKDRREDVPEAGAHPHGSGHAALMPGMLTDDELDQLKQSRGATFDTLFLQYMIRHHEGAVLMVEQLLTEGFGGQESQVFQLAQHMDSDQRVEISRMKSLLSQVD